MVDTRDIVLFSPIGAIIQRFVSTLIDSFSVSVTNYEAN